MEASSGFRVRIVDVGATIQSIAMPTPRGRMDAVLSYAKPGEYRTDSYYLGATVGPVANRIRDRAFVPGTGISRRAEPTELPFGTTRRGATYRQSTIYQFALANEGNQATWATGPASRFPSRTNTPGIRLNLAVYSASLSTSDPTDSL
jgi:hypothetical protein